MTLRYYQKSLFWRYGINFIQSNAAKFLEGVKRRCKEVVSPPRGTTIVNVRWESVCPIKTRRVIAIEISTYTQIPQTQSPSAINLPYKRTLPLWPRN